MTGATAGSATCPRQAIENEKPHDVRMSGVTVGSAVIRLPVKVPRRPRTSKNKKRG